MTLLPKKVLIIGAGVSGKACANLLKKKAVSVYIHDDKLDKIYKDLGDIDTVVLSPGVKSNHFLVKEANLLNIPIVNEIDIACLFLPKVKTIGITGTNGKSTVTAMIKKIFEHNNLRAHACGNFGVPVCELLFNDQIKSGDILVIELSSFQLETIKNLKLDIAVIINITPDHLDRYDSFTSYLKTKLKIESLLKENSVLIYDELIESHINFANKIAVQSNNHNQQNTTMARLVAKQLGLNHESINHGISLFTPLPHRYEILGEINGITFINDSKSTTVESTIKALQCNNSPTHLLIGGIKKQNNFSDLHESSYPHVLGFYLFGQDAEKIMKQLKSDKCYCFKDLYTAMKAVLAKANSGQTVLLSPACASYDQFDNYQHRGEVFKNILKVELCCGT